MANFRICSIDGCGKPAKTRGWCRSHYIRWQRHGDPLAGRTLCGEPLKFIHEVVLAYEGDECLTWPFGQSQQRRYGSVHVNGKNVSPSRYICELVHGAPPTPEHQAAHSCGNGEEACITKRHLRWATRVENMADKIDHGTELLGADCNSAKLTEDHVLEIRRLHKAMPNSIVASKFGITKEHVSRIGNRRSWGWLD